MYMLAVGQQSPGTDIHHAQGLQTRSNDRCIPLRMSKERCKFFRVLKGRNQLQPMNFRQLGIFRSWFWRKGNMPCIWAHTAKPLAALAGCGCLEGQGVGSASPHVIGFTSLDFWLHCANAAAVLADLCQLLITAWHCHVRPEHQQSPVCVPCLLPEPFPAPHTMGCWGPELPKNCQQPPHPPENSSNTPVLRATFAGQRTHFK